VVTEKQKKIATMLQTMLTSLLQAVKKTESTIMYGGLLDTPALALLLLGVS